MNERAGTEGTPEGEPQGEPSQPETPATPPVDRRPKPAYGEYAPEGWEWKPEENAGSSAPVAGPTSPASVTDAPARGTSPSSGGRIPGVPHNLGVPGAAQPASGIASSPSTASSTPTSSAPSPDASSTQPSQSNSRGFGEPYRAAASPSEGAGSTPVAPAAAPYATAKAPGPQQKDRKGDRIFTIILLVIGAFGAIMLADSLFRIDVSLMMLSEALGIENFQLPGWVETVSLFGAFGVLILYALTVIFSIQRMRARKLAFWVPLAAGAIASIAVFIITMIATASSPELMERMSDPNALNEVLRYMSENPPQ